MSYRHTYLDALQTELKTYLHSGTNYSTDVTHVKRGVYIFEEMDNYPSIAIRFVDDDYEATFGGSGVRVMNVEIYCYLKPKNVDDLKDLDLFVRDVHFFLENDYTYHSNVRIKEFEFYEGFGKDEQVHEARIDIDILYSVSEI